MVGNLRQVQPDHAARIARFAMDAVQAANNIDVHEDDPSMGRLSIRAGFHSGEVTPSASRSEASEAPVLECRSAVKQALALMRQMAR